MQDQPETTPSHAAAFVAFVAFHIALGHDASPATWANAPADVREAWAASARAVTLYGDA